MFKVARILLLGGMLFSVSALRAESNEAHTDSAKTVVAKVLVRGKQLKFHPYQSSPVENRWLKPLLFPDIGRLGSDWRWSCRLCEGGQWEVKTYLDKSKLKVMKVTYKLRKDLFWSDGFPLTGHDFALAWRALRALPDLYDKPTVVDRIRSIQVSDAEPRKFVVLFSAVDTRFPRLTGLTPLPWHIGKSAEQRDSRKPEILRFLSQNRLKNGLAYGPLKWGGSTKKPTLVQNSKWPGKRVGPMDILFWDSNRELVELVKREPLAVIPESRYEQLPEPIKATLQNSNIIRGTNNAVEVLVINQDNPILMDRRVREALRLAIDTQDLKKKVAHEFGAESGVLLPMDHPYYHPVKNRFNLNKARELLKSSGWKLTPSNSFRRKNNRPLKVTLEIPRNDAVRLQTAESIKLYWSALGVELAIKPVSQTVFFNKRIGESRFSDMALLALRTNVGQPPLDFIDPRQIPNRWNNYTGKNISRWNSAEVKKNLNKIDQSLESAEHAKAFKILQKLIERETPFIALYAHKESLVSPKIQNFDLAPKPYFSYSSEALLQL